MATKSKFYADLGLESASNLQVDGNATITGNLTVNGTTVTVNSSTTSVADSMLELASGNTSSDTLDIGFYGNYDDGLSDGGASEYTGLFRDASDSTWKLFDGLEVEPTSTVNVSGTGYALADLQIGDLTATTITATNSITGASIVFPTSDGTSGQAIVTNGSGTLSFATVSGGLDGGTVTTTSTSETTLDSFAIGTYSSGKYQVSISDSTSGDYQQSEISVVHDGTSAYFTQYGTITTDTGELASFGVDININTLRIRITPASTSLFSISDIAWCKFGSNFLFSVLIFFILFFSNMEIKSFSIIFMFSKNLSKSLLFLRVSSFFIASFALCKLSNIAKLSLAKLNEPNSKASFISFSNLRLWFSISARDLNNLSSDSLSFSSKDFPVSFSALTETFLSGSFSDLSDFFWLSVLIILAI